MTLQQKLDALRALANEQGTYLNEINFCPAGVGLQWWEEERYDDEYPSRAQVLKETSPRESLHVEKTLQEKRYEAGLVVYDYYDDLSTAVDEEMNRLLSEYD